MAQKKKKKALGKGLDVLFPEATPGSVGDNKLVYLDPSKIQMNPNQPRRSFDDEKLSELSASIVEQGLLQPLLIRKSDGANQLVAGERRLRASKMAGLKKIPCIMVTADDAVSLEMALIENLQRENLNPMEEARGYARLIKSFGLTQEETADRVGKERSTVANSLRLLKLPPTMQEDLEVGRISSGHARAILSLVDKRLQARLWSAILQKGLSVRQAEIMAREMKEKKGKKGQKKQEQRPPDIVSMEEKMMAAFGTRVRIKPKSKTSGRIVIDYHNLEDMDRIMETLGIMEE